ncbi:hypothetical protein F2Q68_00027695 [Brassica cretica]|uniref:Uncharacterized protein n=1 Tax=Brassica cretica TaxID=69181 RepID=A0A8S9ICC1_BRACR|nr:hypothetical protein F2Q68_00027695 [Brassica cretica]
MYSGVPKLKFPLVWDQFLNAKMIVEERRGQGTDEKVLYTAIGEAGSQDLNSRFLLGGGGGIRRYGSFKMILLF